MKRLRYPCRRSRTCASRILAEMLGASIVLLSGCSGAPEDDLRVWMSETRRQSHPVPVDLPPRPAIEEFQYEASGRLDPFDLTKISASLSAEFNATGLQPDTRRAREPLESFPLDSLRLVGNIRRQGQVVALVEADKVIHQVHLGSHLGPDMGKVIAIGDGAIDIEEMVQDAGNTWAKRRARLVLQEKR
jgi:type IV pilus assembly protein PilP